MSDLKNIIQSVNSKFEYVVDPDTDSWEILPYDILKGDCEDYVLTVIWRLCKESYIRFFFLFLLFPYYQIWFVKSKSGGHAVGYANGLWFDNWTKEALPKEQFFRMTGHKRVFPWIGPLLWIKMIM